MIRMRGYSTWRRDRKVRGHAKDHVKRGIEPSPDLVAVKLIGMNPQLEGDPEYERDLQESVPDQRCEAWSRELEVTEKDLADRPSGWLLRLGIGFLWAVEFAGARTLLLNEGMPPGECTIIAAAAACLLTYLTYRAAKESA